MQSHPSNLSLIRDDKRAPPPFAIGGSRAASGLSTTGPLNLENPMPELIAGMIDVFADVPLAGNPLSVVQGADELSDEQMLRIAEGSAFPAEDRSTAQARETKNDNK